MVHGVINVKKEKGFTSHDVVAKLRGIVGQKKIGHTGTLDPDATGVLPVCLGKATKLCDLLTDKNKTYEAVLLLGVDTDTQDITGEVRKTCDTSALKEQDVTDCIQGYIGEYDQVPPMYSALKVNGKKLYELAREGKEVERKARRVTIFDIQILEMNLPEVRMSVTCSKGTYIRTLCYDIGESLLVGGCMKSLVRTRVERFELQDAFTLSEIEEKKNAGQLSEILVPIDQMFDQYEKVVMIPKFTPLAYNGNSFPLECVQTESVKSGLVRIYDEKQRFIGLYNFDEKENLFQIRKMFLDQNEIRG